MRFALSAVVGLTGLVLLGGAILGQPALYLQEVRRQWVAFVNPTPAEPAPSAKLPAIEVMVLPANTSPRKRKHPLDHLALDVLADVTVASPLIH